MARMRLIDFLSHPEKLDEKTLDTLREALDTYPFFQAGRMLWVKNLCQLDHIRYNSELKLSAAYIPDRSKLFFLINDVFSSLSVPDVDESQQNIEGESEQPEKNEQKLSQDETIKGRDDNEATRNNLSDELGQVVGADANYFDVDDSFTTSSGDLVDFSLSREQENGKKQGVRIQKNERDESPESGMLDYEKSVVALAYSLEKEMPSEPADFDMSHSFSEWLDLLKYQTAKTRDEQDQQAEVKSGIREKTGKMDLIENFLNKRGHQKKIVPGDDDHTTGEDFSARSVAESDDLMTETLANIHIKQKRYQKAVEIFERLRLKYPEKSVYFARRIKEMEDLINNQ